MDFGHKEELRICIIRETNISHNQADEIITKINAEFSQYGINITVPWIKKFERQSLSRKEIIKRFFQSPLEAPCDRLLLLFGSSPGDFLRGMMLIPEALGGVELKTMTKGFLVAELGSVNQALSFRLPSSVAIHETYHLLGCGHALSMQACHRKITDIKRLKRKNAAIGEDFFPSLTLEGELYLNRSEVNLSKNK